MELLGIDTNEVPEASEYAGVISMIRLTASNNWEAQKANLETGYSEDVQTISGHDWTIIKGKTVYYEEAGFGGLFIKYAYVTVGGKEFVVRLESSLVDYGGQESNFDTFVKTVKFY